MPAPTSPARRPSRLWGRVMSIWARARNARPRRWARATFTAAADLGLNRKGCDAGRMTARLLALTLFALPLSAQAAEHRYAFGSYDRVRIEGPFEVTVTTGVAPGALASGDSRTIEGLDISVQGSTLIVRIGHQGWGETPVGAAAARPVITLTTPALNGAFVNGGARVTIRGMKAQRVDLSVNGSGTVTVSGADTD